MRSGQLILCGRELAAEVNNLLFVFPESFKKCATLFLRLLHLRTLGTKVCEIIESENLAALEE